MTGAGASAQRRAIQVQDGDLVLLPRGATVTIVQSAEGHLRLSLRRDGRLLVVLLDEGPAPDGIVDLAPRFDLLQPFPPEYLWDGPATFEQYEDVGGLTRRASVFGFVTPHGRILVTGRLSPSDERFLPEHVVAVPSTGHSSRRTRASFAEAEREILSGQPPGVQARLEIAPGATVERGGAAPGPGAAGTPIRVGGRVPPSAKIKDVRPVRPPLAREAGVHGIVVVEITIDPQGKVADARIVRSVPLLDQAALDAVRQWEFTPTFVDGVAVPVVMTASVRFEPDR
ncbi:MAG TPA: energy transducer TonB [Vicinamibacterales bacterium]|nr:energy transducer TonB [Vicinamibacterales bacterium]